tara:strand:+ start:5828 stop:6025 length:198 start_codon:yes stop_codon:yes gene_type:complete
MLSKQCKAHLDDVGETGFQHMVSALKIALKLQLLVPALIIHSIAPRLFTKTTTKVLKDILQSREK